MTVGASSTKLGTSSPPWGKLITNSCKSLCCLGPNCWMISGSKSLMVFVSGSPQTMNVLFWRDAYANHMNYVILSGFLKCKMVLSSLKKLISSTPSCWAPTFLTIVFTILSPPVYNQNYCHTVGLLTTLTFLLWEPFPPVLASPTFPLNFAMFYWISCSLNPYIFFDYFFLNKSI